MLGDCNQNRNVTAHSVDILVTLALVSLFAFLSFRILSPFLSILIWAAILAVALHPVFVVLKARLWGSGGWSATILALIVISALAAYGAWSAMSGWQGGEEEA